MTSATHPAEQTASSVGMRRAWIEGTLLVLTVMLAGRAMTIAFVGRAGGSELGDPPAAWLMPLLGDAIIGLSALPVALSTRARKGTTTTVIATVWNAVAIWDALSAFAVHKTNPWPTFFMIEIFGSSMFFMAAAMHGVCIYLLWRPERLLTAASEGEEKVAPV